jgi:preprotein translocase subunit SecG
MMELAHVIFALSLIFLLTSIVLSLLEINKSTKAIELELSDIEELNKNNIFTDMFSKEDES